MLMSVGCVGVVGCLFVDTYCSVLNVHVQSLREKIKTVGNKTKKNIGTLGYPERLFF